LQKIKAGRIPKSIFIGKSAALLPPAPHDLNPPYTNGHKDRPRTARRGTKWARFYDDRLIDKFNQKSLFATPDIA